MTVCPLTHPENTYPLPSGCQALDWVMGTAVNGTFMVCTFSKSGTDRGKCTRQVISGKDMCRERSVRVWAHAAGQGELKGTSNGFRPQPWLRDILEYSKWRNSR